MTPLRYINACWRMHITTEKMLQHKYNTVDPDSLSMNYFRFINGRCKHRGKPTPALADSKVVICAHES